MRFWTKALGLGVVCVLIANAGAQQNAQQSPQNQNKSTDPNAPRFDAKRFLKDHDTNGDGKLSKDELPAAARDEFADIDTNKDGFITLDELQQHAARMSQQRPQLTEVIFYTIDIPEQPATTQELQTAYNELRKLDKNGDGKITEDEVKAFREERKKQRLDQIFDALDKNKDGKISKDEARGFWADDFAQLDKNGDGVLDRQEVEAACMHNRNQKGQNGQNGK